MKYNSELVRKGKTALAVSRPWGLNIKTGTRALCSDGKVRSVAYLAETADTYFSIPASVRVNGKTVSGYVTTAEQKWIPEVKTTEPFLSAYIFRQYTNKTNSALLPAWPDAPDQGEAYNALLSKAYE